MSDDEKDAINKEILSKIHATMSDRASVMKAFNVKLQELRLKSFPNAQMHFLYCNAHFLLGLSSAAESVLQGLEKDLAPLGRSKSAAFKFWQADIATVRVVRATSNALGPRGDEKSGCRQEWLAFCALEQQGSRLTSYRSNRFNNTFENAAAVLFHRDDIKNFLSSYTSTFLMKESYPSWQQWPLFFYFVTSPYWSLLNCSISFFAFISKAKTLKSKIASLSSDPTPLLNGHLQGIFDGEFAKKDSALLDAIQEAVALNSELTSKALKELLAAFDAVAERQLSDFISPTGPFSGDLPEDVIEELKRYPGTNLVGEHAFGHLDYDITKRRNSTLHHRSSCQMLLWNDTVSWLSKQPKKEQEHLMTEARKLGPALRSKHRQQEALVKFKLKQRIAEVERLKREREMKAAEERQKVLTSVLQMGGPCLQPSDLSRCSTPQHLKDQIKYHTLILGVKGLRVTGTKSHLHSLLHHYLETGSTLKVSSPPKKRQRLMSASLSLSGSDVSSAEENLDHDVAMPDVPFSFERQGT
ncbi:hypothetical protein ElyMa_006111300 [Elysia marginata]|uniref:SAP domain-containing protein n=1 Tax=Elysia marginata TaxID=1093978 RepID=A0AAV4GV10_9GAST|nr:hypothetical protein ElyMa_006111300 [Elysia marginata]